MRRLPLLATALLAACATTAGRGRIVAPPAPAEQTALIREIRRTIDSVGAEAFESGSFPAADGTVIPYRLLRPPVSATGGGVHPLVVVLHGSGAIGDDNRAQVDILLKGWASEEARRRFPAFVVAPQFPRRPDAALREGLLALIDDLRKRFPIDDRRIYLSGFSMGAGGVWNAIQARPRFFAAGAAIAGMATSATIAATGATPILVVHGDRDGSYPAMMKLLDQAHPPNVEVWQYLGVAHELAPQPVAGYEIQAWLFRHVRE
jgi:predicted peptidase